MFCLFLLYQTQYQFKIFLYTVGGSDFAVATMQEEMNLPIHILRPCVTFFYPLLFHMAHCWTSIILQTLAENMSNVWFTRSWTPPCCGGINLLTNTTFKNWEKQGTSWQVFVWTGLYFENALLLYGKASSAQGKLSEMFDFLPSPAWGVDFTTFFLRFSTNVSRVDFSIKSVCGG